MHTNGKTRSQGILQSSACRWGEANVQDEESRRPHSPPTQAGPVSSPACCLETALPRVDGIKKPVRLPHLSPRSGSSPCRRWHRKGHLEPSRTSGTTLTKLLCVGGDTSNQKYSEVGKDDKRGSNSERKRERQNHPLICTYCFAKKLESTEPVPRGGP